MRNWIAKAVFMVFIVMLSVLVALPETSSGQCSVGGAAACGAGAGGFGGGGGGGLFGGRARRQARREGRSERRGARAGGGCAGMASYGCAGVEQAPSKTYVPMQQAPSQQAPTKTYPATNIPRYILPLVPGKSEAVSPEYPSAAFDSVPEQYFVSMTSTSIEEVPINPGW